MRGLNIRVQYVRTKFVVRTLKCDDDLREILLDTEQLSHNDYHAELDTPLGMFRSESALLKAWKFGWTVTPRSSHLPHTHSLANSHVPYMPYRRRSAGAHRRPLRHRARRPDAGSV